MATAEEWPWLLLDALDAAAEQAPSELHLELCPFWSGRDCSCGVPGMLVEVRDRVFAQAGARIADGIGQEQRAV